MSTTQPAMSVRDKLKDGAYISKVVVPERPLRRSSKIDVTKVTDAQLSQARTDALSAESLMEVYYQAYEAYYQAYDAYLSDTHRLEAAFKADLEAEFGLSRHKKAGLLWHKAWERGHSSGLGEVLSAYEDLAELLL